MMTFSELLMKMADGEKLTPVEKEELRQQSIRIDESQNRTSSWVDIMGNIKPSAIFSAFDLVYSYTLEKDLSELFVDVSPKHTHLMILSQGKINNTGGQTTAVIDVQFNSDTGNNYVWGRMYHLGATVTGEQDTSDPSIRFGSWTADGDADANNSGQIIAFIPHVNSPYYKSVLMLNSANFTTGVFGAVREGLWKSTSRINRIRFFVNAAFPGAKIQTGSVISVYGLY